MNFPIYIKMLNNLEIHDIFMIHPYVQFASNLLETYNTGNLISWITPEGLINKRYNAYGNAREIKETDFGVNYRTRSTLLHGFDWSDDTRQYEPTSEEKQKKLEEIQGKIIKAYRKVLRQTDTPVGKQVVELMELLYTLEEAQHGNHIKGNLTSAPVYLENNKKHPFNDNLLGNMLKSKIVVSLVPTSKTGEGLLKSAYTRFQEQQVSADNYQAVFEEIEEGVPVSIIQVIFGIYTGCEILSHLVNSND